MPLKYTLKMVNMVNFMRFFYHNFLKVGRQKRSRLRVSCLFQDSPGPEPHHLEKAWARGTLDQAESHLPPFYR